MTTITFTAYQSYINRKGEEKNIAIERTANVADITSLNHVMGGIYQALFNLQSLATFTNRRIFSLSQPIYLRFKFNDEVIDTASFEKELLPAMKMTNKFEGKKKFAKNTWAMMIDHTTVHEPVAYVEHLQDTVPVRLLGTVQQPPAQIENGVRMTGKIAAPKKAKRVAKNKQKAESVLQPVK